MILMHTRNRGINYLNSLYLNEKQFCDGSAATSDVQPYKYNFSVKREERKHVFSSEREKNRPKVNGKELDVMHGMNTYDYGAMQYNPVTARWDRPDPLAEKYYSVSPYVYCANNPVMLVDPDGQDGVRIVDEENMEITIKATYFVVTESCSGGFVICPH